MKLITKLTWWYLALTVFVLIAGGLLIIITVQREVDEEISMRLKALSVDIKDQIENGISISEITNNHIIVKEVENPNAKLPFQYIDTSAYYSPSVGEERMLIARAIYPINGKKYFVEVSEFLIEKGEVRSAVLASIGWIIVLFLLIMGLINRQVSRIMLMPFYRILKAVQSFKLSQQVQIELPDTNVQEFKELKYFLEEMTHKAHEEYQLLKEFTENSSHELQTPLSIIRGKLELLMESGINDEQAKLILPAYDSIEKLSKINTSLALLVKMDNKQFVSFRPNNLSELTREALEKFAELIEMKSLTLKTEIDDHIQLNLNLALIDILLINLINNAIRHNHVNGEIIVSLSTKKFIIRNTGNPPEVPVKQLFQRFKKSNQSSDSIGLGLSIVKKICELHNFTIQYEYSDQIHSIEITF
jgi:signal transduction histidine kinase